MSDKPRYLQISRDALHITSTARGRKLLADVRQQIGVWLARAGRAVPNEELPKLGEQMVATVDAIRKQLAAEEAAVEVAEEAKE